MIECTVADVPEQRADDSMEDVPELLLVEAGGERAVHHVHVHDVRVPAHGDHAGGVDRDAPVSLA